MAEMGHRIDKPCLFPGQPEPAHRQGFGLDTEIGDKEGSAFHIHRGAGKLFALKLNQATNTAKQKGRRKR